MIPKAMILAAGLGTRLKPLTETTPKALLLIAGVPLITYQIRLLVRYGCREVVINLHWLGELIEKELGSGKKFGARIRYSYEEKILGTGGGILKAASFFGGKPFLVMNSDILIDVDLKRLMEVHAARKGLATLVLAPLGSHETYTPVWMNRKGRLRKIGGEAPKGLAPAEKWMFTGVQVLTRKLLERLPDRHPSCIIRDGIEPAVAAQVPVFGFPYHGYFKDVGTLERYRDADHDLTSGAVKLSY